MRATDVPSVKMNKKKGFIADFINPVNSNDLENRNGSPELKLFKSFLFIFMQDSDIKGL